MEITDYGTAAVDNFTIARRRKNKRRMAAAIGNDGANMPRVDPHNYLDNAASYGDLFPVNALYKNFSLATTNVVPFGGGDQINTPLMFCMAAGYGLGRCYFEGDANTATVDKGIVVAVGEILAPGLPRTLWLDVDLSRAKLINVRKIMGTQQVFLYFNIATENFVQRYAEQFHIDQRFQIAIGSDDWATVDMDRHVAMKLFAAVGDAILRLQPALPQRMMVTMLIATLQKESMTDPFAQKIMNGLRTELGIDILLAPELVKDTARAYGAYMSADVARRVVTDWRTWIPEGALRLRLTVNQAVWEGLTGFNTVKRTVQALPHFPWEEVGDIPIYASEMEAVRRAAETIQDDEFYGFNRDLGVASIRNYKNLASVCAAIQHRALGDEQIQRARCFTMQYAYQERINRIINDYLNHEGRPDNLGAVTRNFLEAFGVNRPGPNQEEQ